MAGVRLRAAQLLPSLSRTLMLPDAAELADKLGHALNGLRHDMQPDIAAMARAVAEDCVRMPVNCSFQTSTTMLTK